MTAFKPDLPCLSTCGGRMQLQAAVKRTGFALYICPTCRREVIETVQPMVSDSTGQDAKALPADKVGAA